jgi:tetratricopeptide (TPR) repeat protein
LTKRNRHVRMRRKSHLFTCLLILLMPFVPVQYATAMTAEQYFADANRLVRDDLYWAALLRYRQAIDEGLNTPLLHYNMAVAHYRARQHILAHESFLRALKNPTLRVVTHYNLGLNAYALGNTDEALRWFRLSRDQTQDATLQNYSVVAISRIREEQVTPDKFELRTKEREENRSFSDLELRARVGFGSDSNVFRSPDQPYIDFSNPLRPIITPTAQSGTFVPVSLAAKYRINSLPYEGFFVDYRLAGRYYPDEELENGNEYLHEMGFGSEYYRQEGERERSVYSAFRVARHDETYYDPDDGGSRIVGGVDIGDRMNYLRYGPELVVRQSHERLAFGAKVKGQLLNYEEQETVAEYDHEFFLLSVYGQYRFWKSTLFRVSIDGYTRRFSDRPSFDLDGRQRAGNPNIRYDYYSVGLSVRQGIMDSMWFGFDVKRTDRTDKYVGYYNYTRDRVGFEFHWAASDRFDLGLNASYSIYDYANAFAFHEPLAGSRTQEVGKAGLVGSYRMTQHLTLIGEAWQHETVSNDTRIQYARSQYTLGIRWDR